MNRFAVILYVSFFVGISSSAQSGDLYFLMLKDKPIVDFRPETYFKEKAQTRREKHGLASFDWTDLPLNPNYVHQISQQVNELRHELRWFNAISVRATETQLREVVNLPFVVSFSPVNEMVTLAEEGSKKRDSSLSKKLSNLLEMQRKQMNLNEFAKRGIDGKGVRIAVFDAGFNEVNTHISFANIREEGRILKTRNFYQPDHDIYEHSYHGTGVLGCIGGSYMEKAIGAATGAEFLLARTEHLYKEKIIEEDHWLAAMEWADKEGADIISSSLGYTDKRYEYENMDGTSTLVTRAAQMAASKGILVVNSAGNEGHKKFHYIGAPADGDSVLTVGGTLPMSKSRIRFSSYGPNFNGELKPNVSAVAYVVSAGPKNNYTVHGGTSFSCPLVTGFAACVMQLYPEKTNMEIFELIEQSGHMYPYFDYSLGYGVPDAGKFFDSVPAFDPSFHVSSKGDSLIIHFQRYESRNDTISNKITQPTYLHYHLADSTGRLLDYQTKIVPEGAKYFLLPVGIRKEGLLRISYEGYFWEDDERE